MFRPFIATEIDRSGDVARVRIYRVMDNGGAFHRVVLEDYETASRGAAASARRAKAKAEAAL